MPSFDDAAAREWWERTWQLEKGQPMVDAVRRLVEEQVGAERAAVVRAIESATRAWCSCGGGGAGQPGTCGVCEVYHALKAIERGEHTEESDD